MYSVSDQFDSFVNCNESLLNIKSYLADKHNQISKGFVCIWGIKLKNLKVGFIVPKLLEKLKKKNEILPALKKEIYRYVK